MREPMTAADLHGFDTPPHCNASSRQLRPAMIRSEPIISICMSFSRMLALRASLITDAFGVLKVKIMIAAATPPIGRLM